MSGTVNSVYTYNIWGSDMLGQVKDNAGSLTRFYYLKDHLGDIKMVLNQSGGVDSYNDFYPFGLQMPNRNQAGTADGRYKFISVEQDVETGLDATGDRSYDPWSGRFRTTDPFADFYPDQSAYSYSFNNPVCFLDPSGDSTTSSYPEPQQTLYVSPFIPPVDIPSMPPLDLAPVTISPPDATSLPTVIPSSNLPVINFGPDAVASDVSMYSLETIYGIMRMSKTHSLTLTSTNRTVESQARAMYYNMEHHKTVRYGAAGRRVLQKYPDLDAMIAQIYKEGPYKVSHHLGDPRILNVFDIGPRSVANRSAFVRGVGQYRALDNGVISIFLGPGFGDEGSYHFEIPQP